MHYVKYNITILYQETYFDINLESPTLITKHTTV